MANEQLTIQPNDARMTVIGKSWPDQASDSGGGDWDDTYNGTYSGPIPRTDLPVRIAVTTPPTKTEYIDGERIDLSGIRVTAYLNDDSELGIVPIKDLFCNPAVALFMNAISFIYEDSGIRAIRCVCDTPSYATYFVFGRPLPLRTFQGYVYPHALGEKDNHPATIGKHNEPGITYLTRYYAPERGEYYMFAANESGDNGVDLWEYTQDDIGETTWINRGVTTARAGDRVFEQGGWEEYWTNVPESTKDPSGKSIDDLPLVSGIVEVPVIWKRPEDNLELSTSIEIMVTPPSNGENSHSQGGR